MSGPKKIIDLDNTPPSDWRVDPNAAHIHKGKLWLQEPAGCVLCADADHQDVTSRTLRNHDGDSFFCLTHGELEKVRFYVKREYFIHIGDFEKRGLQEVDDSILVPVSIPSSERPALYQRLVQAAAEVEDEDSLLSDD